MPSGLTTPHGKKPPTNHTSNGQLQISIKFILPSITMEVLKPISTPPKITPKSYSIPPHKTLRELLINHETCCNDEGRKHGGELKLRNENLN